MSYSYEKEKPDLFTDVGQRLFLKVRERIFRILDMAGAVTCGKAISSVDTPNGLTTFTLLAAIDRMVELGEIKKVYSGGAGQDDVYVSLRG